jgi:hypothetical protein
MRRLLIVVGTTLVLAPAASAGTLNPCTLVNTSDASTALSAKTGQGKAQTVGLYKACTYTSGKRKLTVLVRALASKAAFDKSAKKNPGPVIQLPGIGDDAYSAGAGTTLLVWKKGIELTFTFSGTNPVVQTQKDLADAAIARL